MWAGGSLVSLCAVVIGFTFLLAIVFYVWGQVEKRNQDVVVEVNLSDMSETELSVGAGE